MAILISQATADSNNSLALTSNDANNTFYGTSYTDTVSYSGTGNFTMLDVSTGDTISIAQNGSGATAALNGNTVTLVASGHSYTLGGIADGDSITVTFTGDSNSTAITRTGNNYYAGTTLLVNAAAGVAFTFGSFTTLASASASFTGTTTFADTLDVGNFEVTGALNGGATAANTLVVKDGANLSGATVSNFANLTFDATGVSGTNDVTMTAAQHAGFSGTVTAAGTGANGEKITLTTASTTIAAYSAVENYVLTGAGTNIITLAAAGQNVTTAANASTQFINTGMLASYTGAVTGNATDNTVLVIGANNTDISGATLNNSVATGVDKLAQGTNAVTMTAAQHASLIGVSATAAITGTGAITINSASTSIAADASPAAYVLTGAGANTITLAAAGQNVTTAANASAQTIKTGALTSYTGTITGNATDTSTVLTIDTTGTDISGATLNIGAATGVDVLAQGTNAVTMTAAQHASLIGVSATAAITGTGAITINSASTSIAADASPAAYVLAGAGANTITLAAAGQNVTTAANASAQTIKTGALTSYTGTITGNATDTSTVLTIDTTATDISGATLNIGAATGVDVLAQGTKAVTMTAAQHASLIGVSATAAITGTGAITINSASTSIAADASPTAYVLTGAGANTITLAAAGQNVTTAANASAQTINTGALTSYTGTITGNGTDTTVLAIGANNTNISGAPLNFGTVFGVDVLAQGANAVIMTAEQHASLIGASATDAITGTGAIILTTAATEAVALDVTVGTYVLAAGANSVTVGTVIGQTINANDLTDAQVLTLAGSPPPGGTATVTLVAGDLTSTYSGNTTVTATTGTNVITTGSGADTITGGAGADSLTGGAGSDVFVYDNFVDWSATESVTDFGTGGRNSTALSNAAITGLNGDVLRFDYSNLGLIPNAGFASEPNGSNGSTLGASAIVQGVGAQTANQTYAQFLYNSTSGLLSFDADGTGNVGAVGIALIGTGLSLTATDILLIA